MYNDWHHASEQVTASKVDRLMWWSRPTPKTDDEREREIRRLEGVRDKLLDEASKHFYFRRFLLPVMLVIVLFVIGRTVWLRPANFTIGAALLLAGVMFMMGSSTWRVWKRTPPPGDGWGFSDGLGYEGDSPRDVQRKIEALRAQMQGPGSSPDRSRPD
jgi:hypothetical protein